MFMWFPPSGTATSGNQQSPALTSWSAPGTCGEFVQGRLDGADFLINSPIDCFSTAWVRARPGDGATVLDAHHRSKVARALAGLSERVSFPRGIEVVITSDLPHGKGMASSTADLVAAIGAALDQAGAVWSIDDIARLLVEIEPSDCTHVPGIGHVGHLCGRVFGSFAPPQALRVLVVDCGGAVDTIAFDRARAHSVYARNEDVMRATLSVALRSLERRCAAGLARAATMSARLSQQILPKPQLEDLIATGHEHGALGVNCAHSGSVLGLLYQPSGDRGERIRGAIERTFGADVTVIGDHRFISGGVYVRQH